MRNHVAQATRAAYERHPYPAVAKGAVERAPWPLPPFDWISSIAQPSGNPPRRILVAGCGTGQEAFAIRRRFPRAEIVGIDFAARSIRLARQLQKRSARTRDIRFLHADLTSEGLAETTGGGFDFISCHGVLSYLPELDRALRNLARCLAPDGVLYLGVNGASHFSEGWRKFLPAFEIGMESWTGGARVWRHLEFTSHLAGDPRCQNLKHGASYLSSDLFTPLMRNLPLSDWVRRCERAGLHFRASYAGSRLLRPAVNSGMSGLLLPRSRGEVAELLETLRPGAFHELIFTRHPEVTPPWRNARDFLKWRPLRTEYMRRFKWPSRRGGRVFQLENRAANIAIELRGARWELELLRASDGAHSIGEILAHFTPAIAPAVLRSQLYLFYLLDLLNFLPPSAGRAPSRQAGSVVVARKRALRRRSPRGA